MKIYAAKVTYSGCSVLLMFYHTRKTLFFPLFLFIKMVVCSPCQYIQLLHVTDECFLYVPTYCRSAISHQSQGCCNVRLCFHVFYNGRAGLKARKAFITFNGLYEIINKKKGFLTFTKRCEDFGENPCLESPSLTRMVFIFSFTGLGKRVQGGSTAKQKHYGTTVPLQLVGQEWKPVSQLQSQVGNSSSNTKTSVLHGFS